MRRTKILGLFLVIMGCGMAMNLWDLAHAQEAGQQGALDFGVLWRVVTPSVLQALWVAGGPMLTALLTAAVNRFAGLYVPRAVQVVLSGVLTAVAAGLTGTVEASAGFGDGVVGQLLAATNPKTLRTEAPQ